MRRTLNFIIFQKNSINLMMQEVISEKKKKFKDWKKSLPEKATSTLIRKKQKLFY